MTESRRRDRHYFEQVKRCWATLPETGPGHWGAACRDPEILATLHGSRPGKGTGPDRMSQR